jgi:hypothetical protein
MYAIAKMGVQACRQQGTCRLCALSAHYVARISLLAAVSIMCCWCCSRRLLKQCARLIYIAGVACRSNAEGSCWTSPAVLCVDVLRCAVLCCAVQVGAERYNLFTDCPQARTATIVLRGGSEQVSMQPAGPPAAAVLSCCCW